MKELPGRRTPTSKVFQLADGRTEAELSSDPIHFQASNGTLRPIDTTVKASRASGFSLANESNSFRSFFGTRVDELVKFDLGGHGMTLGMATTKALTPSAAGDTVTCPDMFGDADLVYQVGPDQLKESIALESAPAGPTYRFSLKPTGVKAVEQSDGSIAFHPASGFPRPPAGSELTGQALGATDRLQRGDALDLCIAARRVTRWRIAIGWRAVRSLGAAVPADEA
ncbi:hypothetical protein [Kribbella sp. NPDC023855]|uniref:hypothetical protein n=1 Tax=Kribbella sp. NPDC023855 TaxID=3154698 RepID=UPI0033F472EA